MQGPLSIMNEGVAATARGGFFFNSRSQVIETGPDLRVLARSGPNFVPPDLYAKGYHHCGDADYLASRNLLLMPCSCYPRKTPPPFIAFMNATSFAFTGDVAFIADQGDVPWVAADKATGFVYTSDYWTISSVLELDAALAPRRRIRLSRRVSEVQGGAVLNGTLYLSSNINDAVYAVDLQTGAVAVAIEQRGGDEMEGMAVVDLQHLGKGLLHFFENGSPKRMFHYVPVDSHDADADLRASINLPSRAPVSPGRNLPYLSKSPRISRTSSTRRAAVSRETEATAPRPRPRPRGAALSTTHSTAAPVLAELSPASPDSEPPISSRPRSVHDADVVARWLRPYLWSRPPMQITAHDGQHGSDAEYTADDIFEHARERRPKDRCKSCEMHRTRGA